MCPIKTGNSPGLSVIPPSYYRRAKRRNRKISNNAMYTFTMPRPLTAPRT